MLPLTHVLQHMCCLSHPCFPQQTLVCLPCRASSAPSGLTSRYLLLLPLPPPHPCTLAQQLKSLPAEERYDAERRAKQRLLGNIRLIAELFNKAQVNDRIMLLILADLLGGPDNDPPEDSVEVRGGVVWGGGAEFERVCCVW